MLSLLNYLGYATVGLTDSIARGLASILYTTTLGSFVYSTDTSGNAILANQGGTRTVNDGLLNTGRAVELGATNDLAIPIHHTLGIDGSNHLMAPVATEIATTDNLDGSYSVIGTSTLNTSYMEIADALSLRLL